MKQSSGIAFVPLLSFALCTQGKHHALVYFISSNNLTPPVLVRRCAFRDGRGSLGHCRGVYLVHFKTAFLPLLATCDLLRAMHASTTPLSGIWATFLLSQIFTTWENSAVRRKLALQTKAELGPLEHAGIAHTPPQVGQNSLLIKSSSDKANSFSECTYWQMRSDLSVAWAIQWGHKLVASLSLLAPSRLCAPIFPPLHVKHWRSVRESNTQVCSPLECKVILVSALVADQPKRPHLVATWWPIAKVWPQRGGYQCTGPRCIQACCWGLPYGPQPLRFPSSVSCLKGP